MPKKRLPKSSALDAIEHRLRTTLPKPRPRRLPVIEFGIVRITGGAHASKLGFYDDDDIDGDGRVRAVVYLDGDGAPLSGRPPVYVPHRLLAAASPDEQAAYESRNMNDISYAQAKKRLLRNREP